MRLHADQVEEQLSHPSLVKDETRPEGQASMRRLAAHEASNAGALLDLVSVVEPGKDRSIQALSSFLSEHRGAINKQMTQGGCVLFRGFDLSSQGFEQLIDTHFQSDRYLWMLPLPPKWGRLLLSIPLLGLFLNYLFKCIEEKATGRQLKSQDISTLAVDDTVQFPHHEYGIFFNIPKTLAFFCQQEAGQSGETIICDAERAWKNLGEPIRQKLESTQHIRYDNENQALMPPLRAPAILKHPETGHKSANLTAYYHDVVADTVMSYFPGVLAHTEQADSTFLFEPTLIDLEGASISLSNDEVVDIVKAHLEACVLLKWKTGDVLLMDNFKAVHGRLNGGKPRKTLQVILCDHIWNA